MIVSLFIFIFITDFVLCGAFCNVMCSNTLCLSLADTIVSYYQTQIIIGPPYPPKNVAKSLSPIMFVVGRCHCRRNCDASLPPKTIMMLATVLHIHYNMSSYQYTHYICSTEQVSVATTVAVVLTVGNGSIINVWMDVLLLLLLLSAPSAG